MAEMAEIAEMAEEGVRSLPPVAPEDIEEMASSQFRLPGDIIPVHYDLEIITNLDTDVFNGRAQIEIRCLEPTDTIKIHERDLALRPDKVTIKSAGGERTHRNLSVVRTYIDNVNDFFVIKTSERLAIGKEYILDLPFTGRLKSNLIGYYKSSYYDSESKSVKSLAVTHFEPSDARQAFPCFDEPGMKATFSIKLGHRDTLKAASNMPLTCIVGIQGRPGWVWSQFETTVRMSTYLIAFMVSEFEVKENQSRTNSGAIFRVWARKDAINQSGFPSQVGPSFLTFYEDFFNIVYPLPKLDLLAIPDFKIGAMENWGIITFRESSLLLDENVVSSSTKLHVATIIAHEIAHMWFGNLVTMNWWTDLWLKEGFATYMANVAVHHEFPKWNTLDTEAFSDLLRVFYLDSLKSSHPVSVPIGHSREISQIFDAISYDKGSFLLRMMNLFLGEEVFRHGLTMYLSEHNYDNADQDNLWSCLTVQAHRYSVLKPELTVKQIMDTWTLQTGYPLITVERDYETSEVTVSQKRYLATKSDDPSDYVGSWWVPLTYSSAKEPDFNCTQPEHWLPKDVESVVLDVEAEEGDWVVFNNRAAGLYKVNYDEKNWRLIIVQLSSSNYEDIDVMNRALLIVDAMDLADCGILDYTTALELVSYIEKETEFLPWCAALSRLKPLMTRLSRTPAFSFYRKFIQSLMGLIVRSLGDLTHEPTSFEQGRLINIITQWGCQFKVGDCPKFAYGLFKTWYKSEDPDNVNPIPKDIRRVVYTHAVGVGGEDVFDFLWVRYKNANVIAEKNNILAALTNTKEVWLINRTLEWSLDETSGIRKQDAFLVFTETASRDVGYYVAQRFFLKNVKQISKYFGRNSNLIGHYFSAIAAKTICQSEYEELQRFSEIHRDLLAPASLTVKQSLETAELNIKWMTDHYDTISNFLAALAETS